jgi:predicted hydrolase (HD superfamily)
MRPGREEALALLHEHVKSDNLRRHALAVEAVMRHLAKKRGADEEEWGVIGLVHDIDYERYPDEHCRRAPEILAGAGWPEDGIRAVVSTKTVNGVRSQHPSSGSQITAGAPSAC